MQWSENLFLVGFDRLRHGFDKRLPVFFWDGQAQRFVLDCAVVKRLELFLDQLVDAFLGSYGLAHQFGRAFRFRAVAKPHPTEVGSRRATLRGWPGGGQKLLS